MIEKNKITGDVFYRIKSDRTGEKIFSEATEKIIDVLKYYNFDVEESCAILSNLNNGIQKISLSSAYSQELKNLF